MFDVSELVSCFSNLSYLLPSVEKFLYSRYSVLFSSECLLYIRYSRQYRWLCRWALLCIYPVLWSSLEYYGLSIPEPLFLWSKVPVEQVRWHLPWQTWNKPAFDLTNCINPADQYMPHFMDRRLQWNDRFLIIVCHIQSWVIIYDLYIILALKHPAIAKIDLT